MSIKIETEIIDTSNITSAIIVDKIQKAIYYDEIGDYINAYNLYKISYLMMYVSPETQFAGSDLDTVISIKINDRANKLREFLIKMIAEQKIQDPQIINKINDLLKKSYTDTDMIEEI